MLLLRATPHPRRADAILRAPRANAEIVLIAHGSCANQRIPAPYWATIAGLDPQLFIFNGDIIYADCYTDGAIDGCPNLAEGWAAFAEHDDIAIVADTLPMVGMLDDHDYGANAGSASNPFKQLAKEHFLHRFGAPQNDVRRTRPRRQEVAQGVQLWPRRPAHPGHPARHALVPLAVCVVAVPTEATARRRGSRARRACAYCAGIERYVPYTAEERERRATTRCSASQWRWLERARSSCVSTPTSASSSRRCRCSPRATAGSAGG